jgi:hypothetical protein
MPGRARVLDSRKEPLLGHRVAVADAAGLDAQSDVPRTGLGNVAFDAIDGTLGTLDGKDAHPGQDRLPDV